MTCQEKILSEEYLDLVINFPITDPFLEQQNIRNISCFLTVNDRYNVIYYDRSFLPPLSVSNFYYPFIPKLLGLMDEFIPEAVGNGFNPQPLIHSGITQVQSAPLTLTGYGVVMAFADTGIDYRNPVFRRPDGSTRILAIWDQTIQTGTPPDGMEYGTLFTREQIDEALASANPLALVPSIDEVGHGTAVASAAAGSILNDGLDFNGAAPDTAIVMVKLKQAKQYMREFYIVPPDVPAYQSNDVMLALRFLDGYFLPMQRPIVFCLGMGTSFGDHTGSSALSRYVDSLGAQAGKAMVVSAGNEGNAQNHYRGMIGISAPDPVELRVAENTRGFIVELWGEAPDLYTISVRSPSGEVLPEVNFRIGQGLEYTFVYEKTVLRLDYQLVEQDTGNELVVIQMEEPAPGIWTIFVSREDRGGTGIFQMWLPINQFVDGEVVFLRPSPETTLTAPSYADSAICVTAYNSVNNSFYYNSSQGFAANGKIKPDLSAPGVDISVTTGRMQGRAVLGRMTGTSMSAALTAGACAQILQWAVVEDEERYLSGLGLRNYLIRGARRDNEYTYPNRQFGYGRLNVEGVFDWIAGF